jgi:hypothetical protein
MLEFRKNRVAYYLSIHIINILIISCKCGEEGTSTKKPYQEEKKYSSEDTLKDLQVEYKKVVENLKNQLDLSIPATYYGFAEENLNISNLSKKDALRVMGELQLDENIKKMEDLKAELEKGANNPSAYDLASEEVKRKLNKFIKKIKTENINSRPNTRPDDLNYFFTYNNFSRAHLIVSNIIKFLEINKKMLELKIKE